ncbi:hypothetical protein B0H14DRAFT_567463 [Mycena olivaceomarginata]|nr:hypothetical protein B0H14DRAFT_567463 [Mycena olivaceomarginata]
MTRSGGLVSNSGITNESSGFLMIQIFTPTFILSSCLCRSHFSPPGTIRSASPLSRRREYTSNVEPSSHCASVPFEAERKTFPSTSIHVSGGFKINFAFRGITRRVLRTSVPICIHLSTSQRVAQRRMYDFFDVVFQWVPQFWALWLLFHRQEQRRRPTCEVLRRVLTRRHLARSLTQSPPLYYGRVAGRSD